jgi:hypothetical protein
MLRGRSRSGDRWTDWRGRTDRRLNGRGFRLGYSRRLDRSGCLRRLAMFDFGLRVRSFRGFHALSTPFRFGFRHVPIAVAERLQSIMHS